MSYLYTAFGIPIASSFELAGLNKREETIIKPNGTIFIRNAPVPDKLIEKPLGKNNFGQYNQNETILILPDVAKFYIYNGCCIDVEPLTDNSSIINQNIYSNGLSIALLQRDLLLFHCSGIFINDSDVVLFAAPKNTGKSTLSVLLQQRGYSPFTDDTTLLTFSNNVCYAQASYPLLRLSDSTISQQKIYKIVDRQMKSADDNKAVFQFHSKFINEKANVKGIVFLECTGTEMFIKELGQAETINLITSNIYRRETVWGMKKQKLEFDFLCNFAGKVPMWKAVRPHSLCTYAKFATMVEENIIHKLLQF